MKHYIRLLLLATICLLPACSSDSRPPRAQSTRTPRATSGAAQPAKSLPGRLLYVSDKQIWLHTGDRARPLDIDGNVRDPAWSPDGSRIAYIRREESFSDLYILNAEDGRATQVTSNDSRLQKRTQAYVHTLFWAAKPVWSPEGDEIIFLSQRNPATHEGEQPSLYEWPLTLFRFPTRLIGTREPNNDDIVPVDQETGDVLSPAWSPNGRYLAFVLASRDEKPRRIMLYDFQTEQVREFPGIPEGAYDPAWSPDGSKLAFAVSQDGATDIWIIEGVGGASPQRVSKLGRSRAPTWAPDGSMLAFVNVGDNGSDLYTLSFTRENERLTPGEPEQITDGEQIDASGGLSWSK